MKMDMTNVVARFKYETAEYTEGYEEPKTDYLNENVCELSA